MTLYDPVNGLHDPCVPCVPCDPYYLPLLLEGPEGGGGTPYYLPLFFGLLRTFCPYGPQTGHTSYTPLTDPSYEPLIRTPNAGLSDEPLLRTPNGTYLIRTPHTNPSCGPLMRAPNGTYLVWP